MAGSNTKTTLIILMVVSLAVPINGAATANAANPAQPVL